MHNADRVRVGIVTARRAPAPLVRDEPLSAVQYAILGLLRGQAAHGYELQRSFTAGSDLAGVVHLEQPSLYAALKDLAGRGLIEGTEAREGLRPPRTVYSLSKRGERLLDVWMRTPVERLRQVRLDFLLKVYFARQRGEAAVRALVDAQIATCHRYLADLEARAAELGPESFAYLVTESRTSAARSTLEWLREYRHRV
ncbi:MAG TPA: PadR family transcriptional regulator [Dehalococcoidia bacterium]|nr:PadR family transcriptional regulator [Dehalococcoidia bacterium]